MHSFYMHAEVRACFARRLEIILARAPEVHVRDCAHKQKKTYMAREADAHMLATRAHRHCRRFSQVSLSPPTSSPPSCARIDSSGEEESGGSEEGPE